MDLSSSTTVAGTRVPSYPFVVNRSYTRNDVFRTIGVPAGSAGPWATGYAPHGFDWFIFCGVGTAGRTGHDYGNRFEGEHLVWFAKGPSKLSHPSIQSLLHPAGRVYLFYRERDRDPFTFGGMATPVEYWDTSPVKVLWALSEADGSPTVALPEEMEVVGVETVFEGARKTIEVNVYERDPNARRKCLAHWGTICVVCSFDFAERYGELGEGFTHVHHLRPLGEVGEGYELDPVADLRPVCPNCHAMLHRKRPALTIEELISRLKALG